MKRSVYFIILAFLCVGLFGQNAVIKEVSGKVEVNDGAKGWVPAKAGMTISIGSMISTGFKAKATIALGDSVVLVKQLTRMKLNELVEKEGTVSTELFLDVGRVTAEVKTSGGKKNDFRLKSPIATAAVRGTTIDFSPSTVVFVDGSGFVYNELGRRVHLNKGSGAEYSFALDNPSGEDFNIADFDVNPFTGDRGGATKGLVVKGMSSVIISLVWQ
jgi:hypothetical protein